MSASAPGRFGGRAVVLVAALVVVVLGAVVVLFSAAAEPATTAPAARAAASDANLHIVVDPPPACRPTAVFPLQCGTYRSTFGGEAVRGVGGGPRQQPLQISFTVRADGLVLLAGSGCWTAEVPMRFVADPDRRRRFPERIAERAGAPRFDTGRCGSRSTGEAGWARSFLRSSLRTETAESFGSGRTAVFFEYQGSAPIGQPQIARNDRRCVPAHVAPFRCGEYRSTGGTGSVAFLAARPFRLSFHHLNGRLTAGLLGRCNALSAELQPDGEAVVATGGASTMMGCPGVRAADDGAVSDFFHGVLRMRQHDGVVTFSSPRGTATFAR